MSGERTKDRLARFKGQFQEAIRLHLKVSHVEVRIALEMVACIGPRQFELTREARCWKTGRQIADKLAVGLRSVERCRVTLQAIGAGSISRNTGGKHQGPIFTFWLPWPERMLREFKKGPRHKALRAKPRQNDPGNDEEPAISGHFEAKPRQEAGQNSMSNPANTPPIPRQNAANLAGPLSPLRRPKDQEDQEIKCSAHVGAQPDSVAPPLPLALPNDQPKQKGERHGQASDPRGTRLPEEWQPSPEDRAVAAGLGLDADLVADKFRDYWVSASGPKARKCSWSATWRNWCRREAEGVFKRRTRLVRGRHPNDDGLM
jgi:hypothetical protein